MTRFLRLLGVLPVLCVQFAQAAGPANQAEMKVILLGTGGPELTASRQGSATLVQAGGQMLLFDTGRGALQRMYESGVHITDSPISSSRTYTRTISRGCRRSG